MTDPLFTSDLHFNHKNIVEYEDRPWTIETQTEEMIRRWNDRVGLFAPIYHLGDFIFGGPSNLPLALDILKQLNGQITFIRGNHCDIRLWKLIEDANLPHIEDICHYKEISVEKQKIVMCHYPFETWNLAHHGSWHLHGHCHGSMLPRGKRLDVGIDNHPERTIFTYQEVKEHMSGQQFVITDHHTGERP